MNKVLIKSLILFVSISILSSCVSKKKYTELEQNLTDTRGQLQKTTMEKENLEAKFAAIEKRVTEYNTKISSLTDVNKSLEKSNYSLQESNNEKLVLVDNNLVAISKNTRDKMNETLAKMSSAELAGAKNLKDSLNLAVAYNLRKSIRYNNVDNEKDIKVNIEKTVVMISISDDLLFNSGSYKVSNKAAATDLLKKLADVINSEPSMDVMVEGHTDNQPIKTSCLEDNWDLSVKRATAIVRVLQNKYGVDSSRLIASGRGSSMPIASNDTKTDRARNRRINIVILPNLNKFFALLAEEEKILD